MWCGHAKQTLILGGSIYWGCLNLSLMYRKQVPVFRSLSSFPNSTDDITEDAMCRAGTCGRKENRFFHLGGMEEEDR